MFLIHIWHNYWPNHRHECNLLWTTWGNFTLPVRLWLLCHILIEGQWRLLWSLNSIFIEYNCCRVNIKLMIYMFSLVILVIFDSLFMVKSMIYNDKTISIATCESISFSEFCQKSFITLQWNLIEGYSFTSLVLNNLFYWAQIHVESILSESSVDWGQFLNSLWPSDAIWRQGSRSTLVQVMACCLTAPSHYLNQCWLIISDVQRYSY